MEASSQDETLIEERIAQMISPSGGKPCYRIAHFIKPSFCSSKQAQTLIHPPPISHLSKPISPILKSLTSKVYFHGWKYPLKNWNSWVDKLHNSYHSIWKQSSINEAIMCSKLEIPKCKVSIFGLVEKWCPETNTFVFPWGEVTITLEDVIVLGGFSVTGESVLCNTSSKNLLEIEENLLRTRVGMMRSKSKKASQQQWLEIWMGKGVDFEHEAFLSLWLSRYVLPADDCSTMNKSVFQIAVLLANGTKIALAPAVLACIYRDFSLLKEKIVSLRDLGDQDDAYVTKLALWAPLQLVQVWIWERFPTLSPKSNAIMSKGMPRIVRWNKVRILGNDDVGSDFDCAGDVFRWRPYSFPLNNWSFDLDLQSYCRCIRACGLVGLDCFEQYFPHRIAMQFGLDQDIPIGFPRVSDTARENAWKMYNKPIGDIKMYMPPKLFESDVTTGYLEWWKKSNVAKKNADWVREKGRVEPAKVNANRVREKGCVERTTTLCKTTSNISEKGCTERTTKSCKTTLIISEKGHAELTTKPCLGTSTISMTGLTAAEKIRIKIENNEAEVPPGFSSKGKRVEAGDSSDQHQSSSKRSRLSPNDPVIDIESGESNASRGSSFQTKMVKLEVDSDDDHQTLTELFGLNGLVRTNRSHNSSHRESPSSSAGDNAFIQEKELGTNCPIEEGTRKELFVELGTESKAGSSVSTEKKEVQTSLSGAYESPEIDLLGRIARLQRIVNMVKTAKITQV